MTTPMMPMMPEAPVSAGAPPLPSIAPEDIILLPPEVEERIVKDADELIDLYFDQNAPIWEMAVQNHNLYFSQTDDPRSDEEKLWRSHIFPPRPQIITESKTAVVYDIVTSSHPLIQAEGVGEEDEGGLFGEKLLSYFMRKMRFRKQLPPMLRNVSIIGTEFNKLYQGRRAHVYSFVPNPQDYDRFQKSLMDAKVALPNIPVPDPIGDPEGFKAYRELLKGVKVRIPDPPIAGKREIRVYYGPMLSRISFFDVWLDPAVDELEDQPAVIHRLVKHERWWRDMAGDEPHKPFRVDAVEKALDRDQVGAASRGGSGSKYGDRFTTHQRAFYDIQGISQTPVNDPMYDKSHEGFECFFGTDGVQGEYPYVVVLNGVIINKRPTTMPYMHGRNPIFAARNLAVGGLFHGISDYRPLQSIFMENASLRNLRLDGAKLSMLPILAKLASIGSPALLKQLKPGMVVSVPRMDAFGQLFKMTMPEGAWREPMDLQSDMASSSAIFPTVEGAPATINRTNATGDAARFNQALARLKMTVAQLEEDHDDFAYQCLGLAYEFLSEQERLNIGGADDPYLELSKDKILEAMDQDYRFLGAVKAINREQVAQKLMEFGKTYAANLTPVEIREAMEVVIAAIGVRNAKSIVSDDGKRDAKEAYDIKERITKIQAKITELNLQQQLQQLTAPAMVPGAVAQAVGDGAGAPPAAPLPQPGAPAPAGPGGPGGPAGEGGDQPPPQ